MNKQLWHSPDGPQNRVMEGNIEENTRSLIISYEKTEKVIKSMKNEKAAGPDDLCQELFKYGGRKFVN